jgi:hypothetical protein
MQRYSLRINARFSHAPSAEQRRRIGGQLQRVHGEGAVPPGIEWSQEGRSAEIIIGALFVEGNPVHVPLVRDEVDRTLRSALTEADDAGLRYEISVEATLIHLGTWPDE